MDAGWITAGAGDLGQGHGELEAMAGRRATGCCGAVVEGIEREDRRKKEALRGGRIEREMGIEGAACAR